MKYDVIIVGGGIVGLSAAYKLNKLKPHAKILVLEKENQISQHQTGHNSGVIHSGIYYKPGSLKAQNCINGYHQLIEFAREYNIPFEICGKVIVATDPDQLATLNMVYERGVKNGLRGLKKLDNSEDIRAYEPHVAGIAGIFVPQTGIIDYQAVAWQLAKLIQVNGVEVHINEEVKTIKKTGATIVVGSVKQTYQTSLLINCAGLQSDRIAKLTSNSLNYKIIPFRGEYYELKKDRQHLVRNLIYPVPDPNFPFLGVHFTRMIHGGIEAGPNAVFAFAREGYSKSKINLKDSIEALTWPGFQKVITRYWKTGVGELYRSFSKAAFTRALQKLIPEIRSEDLVPGGAGVRAQACDREGGLLDDFYITGEKNVINICNAPSPAATSSLSIGDHVAGIALQRLN